MIYLIVMFLGAFYGYYANAGALGDIVLVPEGAQLVVDKTLHPSSTG